MKTGPGWPGGGKTGKTWYFAPSGVSFGPMWFEVGQCAAGEHSGQQPCLRWQRPECSQRSGRRSTVPGFPFRAPRTETERERERETARKTASVLSPARTANRSLCGFVPYPRPLMVALEVEPPLWSKRDGGSHGETIASFRQWRAIIVRDASGTQQRF